MKSKRLRAMESLAMIINNNKILTFLFKRQASTDVMSKNFETVDKILISDHLRENSHYT